MSSIINGAFPQPLCEEMMFPLPKGKNDGLRYEVINFSRAFLHTKGCGNAITSILFLMIKISIYSRRDLHLFHMLKNFERNRGKKWIFLH